MLNKTLSIASAILLTAGLAACDVDQTKEGSVDLPKYEVTKTQEGNVEAPKYDAETADVDVKTEEKTVEVPIVQMEERKVDAPDVDVTTPDQK